VTAQPREELHALAPTEHAPHGLGRTNVLADWQPRHRRSLVDEAHVVRRERRSQVFSRGIFVHAREEQLHMTATNLGHENVSVAKALGCLRFVRLFSAAYPGALDARRLDSQVSKR
jgi:hypothetical protein